MVGLTLALIHSYDMQGIEPLADVEGKLLHFNRSG
jgi:hypothetical protein